jgi:DNA-binding transcriptional MerR regulator
MEDRTPTYRIGQLAERTGVSPERLRAWETRYGLLSPVRSTGNFRLYSRDDERRVKLMRRHLANGLAAAEAAGMARSGVLASAALRAVPAVPDAAVRRARALMHGAIRDYDEGAAERALDELFSRFTIEAVVRDVLLPFLRDLGEAWRTGRATPGQEHFATSLIHARLLGLARGWGTGTGPRALLASPSGERHTIGLLCFGICLARRGWRIAFLGADTPNASIEHAATRIHPELVVIAALQERPWASAAGPIATIASGNRVALGGSAAGEEVARQAGAEWLEGDPITAAARVSRQAAPRREAPGVGLEPTT